MLLAASDLLVCKLVFNASLALSLSFHFILLLYNITSEFMLSKIYEVMLLLRFYFFGTRHSVMVRWFIL